MAKLGPGVVVTGLTLGALAAIGVLAMEANGSEAPAAAAKPEVSASAPASIEPSPAAPALPANSGTGRRVVYAVGAHQVWLVDPKKSPQVLAAFKVTPGSVEPAAGPYRVYSRTAAGTGADGRQIEHVVRFAQQGGIVFGFGAATDGATTAPDPKVRTGGIRSDRADGQTLWDFATNGTEVVVVG